MNEDLLDRLIALEAERTRAWLDRDRERLATLLAEDFIEINYFGRLSKTQLLDDLFPRLTLVSLEPTAYRLTPAGEGAALLSYGCEETIQIDGQRISGRFTIGALYARAAGDWQLVSWQITPDRSTD